MQGAGKQLFAGAALTCDQDRKSGSRHARGLSEDVAKGRGLTDNGLQSWGLQRWVGSVAGEGLYVAHARGSRIRDGNSCLESVTFFQNQRPKAMRAWGNILPAMGSFQVCVSPPQSTTQCPRISPPNPLVIPAATRTENPEAVRCS